jgi:Asp-tRNA(Asn)/Glu-tRNA(Gln) amidotransferase A subunit family amidase
MKRTGNYVSHQTKGLGLANNADDVDEFHDLPISLQLVGRRFEDEKVLATLEYILSNHQ